MERLRSDDAEIFYEIRGKGPPVVLLHPFPCHHEFWNPIAAALESRYRLILPDLRGHGDSEIGEGAAVMQKHARDIARVLEPPAGQGGVDRLLDWRIHPVRILAPFSRTDQRARAV